MQALVWPMAGFEDDHVDGFHKVIFDYINSDDQVVLMRDDQNNWVVFNRRCISSHRGESDCRWIYSEGLEFGSQNYAAEREYSRRLGRKLGSPL